MKPCADSGDAQVERVRPSCLRSSKTDSIPVQWAPRKLPSANERSLEAVQSRVALLASKKMKSAQSGVNLRFPDLAPRHIPGC